MIRPHVELTSTQVAGRNVTLRPWAGTLLEVLVSLVLLALIMQQVVQASARMRASRMLLKNRSEAVAAALMWRSAAHARAAWTLGERGQFPDAVLQWQVTELPPDQTRSSTQRPDPLWRVLHLRRAGDELPFWSCTIRLSDREQPSTTQRSTDSRGNQRR